VVQDRHPPRVGCVKYLNARPLIRGWVGQVTLDNPAALCAQIARGELDVALVSSFEFLRNPIYRIVDGISISSDGPVYSVVVAHRQKIAEIEEIELDPASKTSVNLLRCLLAERDLNPRFVQMPASPHADAARLLIGDQAIRFRRDHPDFQFWDLGEAWKEAAGLPFVYALWLIRTEVPEAKEIANRLRALRDENLADLERLIGVETDFDSEFCGIYYQNYLRFAFGEKEKQGLQLFREWCAKHDLLPECEIEFALV
jgi:chorismate dehydratase